MTTSKTPPGRAPEEKPPPPDADAAAQWYAQTAQRDRDARALSQELPDWLAMWTRRRELQSQLATLAERRTALSERTLTRGLRVLGIITTALALAAFVLSLRSRQRRTHLPGRL